MERHLRTAVTYTNLKVAKGLPLFGTVLIGLIIG